MATTKYIVIGVIRVRTAGTGTGWTTGSGSATSVVSYTAHAGVNSEFSGWTYSWNPGQTGYPDISASIEIDGNVITVTNPKKEWQEGQNIYTGELTLTATFTETGPQPQQIVQVTTATTGGGLGTTTGDGRYKYGTSYTITATPSPGGPGARKSKFVKWTSNTGQVVTTATYIGTATTDITWTAEFQPVFEVRAAKVPAAGGTLMIDALFNCTATGFGEYGYGETCVISITPTDGAQIVKVEDGDGASVTASNNRVSFTVTDDRELKILCGWRTLALSVAIFTDAAESSAGGSVTPDPSGNRAVGYTETLTARPNCGYEPGYAEGRDTIFAFGVFISDPTENPATLTLVGNLTDAIYFTGVDGTQWFGIGSMRGEVYFRSEPNTGRILYSPTAGGAIIYGSNGYPMAQYST